MICPKLLRHGDRAKGGCRGKIDGCNDFHGVKMCYSSMNTKKCDNMKDCRHGYHIKGTVASNQKEVKNVEKDNEKQNGFPKLHKDKEPLKNREPQELNSLGKAECNRNLDSFLDQIFQQQQEMMIEQEKQRKEQSQMQQQMLELMVRLGGALENRMGPIMGIQNTLGNRTFNLRPVG